MRTYIEIILLEYIFSLILTRKFCLLCAPVSLAENFFPKTPSPNPARIPPQTPPAGGKRAEAGRIHNPSQMFRPAESILILLEKGSRKVYNYSTRSNLFRIK